MRGRAEDRPGWMKRSRNSAAFIHGNEDCGLLPLLLVALRELDDVVDESSNRPNLEEAGWPSSRPSGLSRTLPASAVGKSRKIG